VNKKITLHSLAELGAVFGLDDPAGGAADEEPTGASTASAGALDAPAFSGEPAGWTGDEEREVPGGSDTLAPVELEPPAVRDPDADSSSASPEPAAPTLEALLADLDGAVADLAEANRRDEVERVAALAELEEYDRLVAAQRDAEAVLARATRVREEAVALATGAFSDGARAAATRVVERAEHAVVQATVLVDARRTQADRLRDRLDVRRLVAERSRREAAEAARAAADRKAQRLLEIETEVRQALDAGQFERAEALLADAGEDASESEALSSLRSSVALRAQERRVAAVDGALRLARYEYRRCPEEAIAVLETLDLEGLPADLGRQVFGEWAAACARVCRRRGYAEPLRYAPLPGRGAVLARERPNGDYVVLSALGMGPRWQPGATVAARDVGAARPLR
jgi:hypothetical protein